MTSSEDTFTHDDKVYDLTKLRILMRSEPTHIFKIKDLLWVLDYDTPDEERVRNARLRWPLLVTKWNGKWVVLDGLHRLEKCRRKGIGVVPVKIVSSEILKQTFERNL